MFEYSTMNHPCKVLNRELWGAHVNPTRYLEFYPKYPDWLNPHQKEEWRNRGLVIWNATTQLVTHLYANYALRILETLENTDTWKTDGYVIGSPAYRMSISDTKDECPENKGHEKDGWVLTNKIFLSSERAKEFLNFLTAEEAMLFLIATNEDKDVREACAMVVELLFERGKKKRELRGSEN